MVRPDAAAAAHDLHATVNPSLGGGEGFGRHITEPPVRVLPFAALGIAGDRPGPASQHRVECTAGRVDVAMHDRDNRTWAGSKHRAHAIFERPLGVPPT